MASYDVIRVDLSAGFDGQPIAPANIGIDSLMVLQLTAGIGPSLRIGSGPGIPIFAGFTTDVCPPELAGLFLNNPTPGAGELVLLVSYGSLSLGSL